MDLAIKLAQCVIPLLIELVKEAHPDKAAVEHQEITQQLIDKHLYPIKE